VQPAATQLYRLCYVLPDDAFLSSLRRQLQKRGSLSARQIAAVERNYRQRGGSAGLRRLHHTLWRLHRLAELDLAAEDAETVARFLGYAYSKRGLRDTVRPVIGAIEAKYGNQRLDATRRRAAQIIARLQDDRDAGTSSLPSR